MNAKEIIKNSKLSIQQETYTCGPVCLLNVLNLKGDHNHSELEIAELCGAKRGVGISNAELIVAAKKLGLQIVEEQENATVTDIQRCIDNGGYVVVNYFSPFSRNGHYSVVSEYDEQALYFRDSSYGLLRLRKEFFDKFWHNSDKTIHRWYLALK